MGSFLHQPGVKKEKQALMATLDQLRLSLSQLQGHAHESKDERKTKSKIISCRYPHDTIPASTDRGAVGRTQNKNIAKTDKQRARARRKSLKKTAKEKTLRALIPPY